MSSSRLSRLLHFRPRSRPPTEPRSSYPSDVSVDPVNRSTASTATAPTISRKSFPCGIKPLYDPEDAVVDVIFVHGLTGDREKSWTARGSSEPWPQTLLPSKLPTARILTFGYDAYVVDWRGVVSQSRIANHAWNLLTSLASYRDNDDTNERPIIWVCHSLGGLVCEDALVTSRQRTEPHLQNILGSTRGIAFLGTPHHGAGLARWAELLSTSIGVIKKTNSKIVAVLKRDSEVLARIQDGFHTMVMGRRKEGLPIEISCFFEELPLPGVGQVVPQASAILPGYIPIGIHGNHVEMAQFGSADDPGFLAVCGELRRWIKGIGAVEKSRGNLSGSDPSDRQGSQDWHGGSTTRFPVPHTSRSYQRSSKHEAHERICEASEDCEKRRPYANLDRFYKVDYDQLLSKVSQPHPKTCSWLMEEEVVQDWISGKGSSVFWLRGHPGLGKSVFARFLVETLGQRDDSGPRNRRSSMMVFFFCSYQDGRARSLTSLVSSLIHQLILEDSSLAEPIRQKFSDIGPSVTDSIRTLWGLLSDMIAAIRGKTLYIVIDALDELSKTWWAPLVDGFFTILSKSETSIRIAITSRLELEIERAIGTRSGCLDLSEASKNRKDVAVYLSDTILEYGRENSFGEAMSLAVLSEFVKRADGMFLWATLAWTLFKDGVGSWTLSILQSKLRELQRLPPGLDVLYHRILMSVDKRLRAELLASLCWIAVAVRPLTIDEISIALAMRERPRRAADIDMRLNMRSFFKKICPHLVKVDTAETITLVHQSFKVFLLQVTEIQDPETPVRNEFLIDLDPTNYEAGLDCLAYLGLDDYNYDGKLLTTRWTGRNWNTTGVEDRILAKYPFLSYARKHWVSHLRSRDNKDEVWTYFARTLQPEKRRMRWYPEQPAIFSLLNWGLYGLLRQAADHGFDMNETESAYCQTLLHSLIREEAMATMHVWLKQVGVDVNAQDPDGETALHAAVRAQDFPEEIISALISIPGININMEDKRGCTALTLALHWGRERAAKKLLSLPNVDVCKSSSQQESPLINAAIQGWPDIVLAILDKVDTVDPFRDVLGRTILHWAILENMPEAFRIALTKQEAIVDAIDNNGKTALHYAASEGMFPAVNLLVQHGASTTKRANFGESALSLAASGGHFQIVQLLVERMPVFAINAKDGNGWTAMHHALSAGRDDIVLWLLDHPAVNLSRCDKHGRQPIAFAAAYASLAVLKAFLARSPEQMSLTDSFGNTLLHMAAASANAPNVLYLVDLAMASASNSNSTTATTTTLISAELVSSNAKNAKNAWGKQPLDLAPTSLFHEFLASEGFAHSEVHLQQRKVLQRSTRYLAQPPSYPCVATGSGWEVVNSKWDWDGFPNPQTNPEGEKFPVPPPGFDGLWELYHGRRRTGRVWSNRS